MAPTEPAFEAAYVAFVQRAMLRHDKAQTGVLLACGPMMNRWCPYVPKIVATLDALGYHASFVNVSLPESPFPLKGCEDHPNEAEDTQCMQLAIGALRDLTGWAVDTAAG